MLSNQQRAVLAKLGKSTKMADHGLSPSSTKLPLLRLQRDEITAIARIVPCAPIPKNYPKPPIIEVSLIRIRYVVGLLMALTFDNSVRQVLDAHNIDLMVDVDTVRLIYQDETGENHTQIYHPIPGVGHALQTFFDGLLEADVPPDRIRIPANLPQPVVEVVVRMPPANESTDSLLTTARATPELKAGPESSGRYTIRSTK